MKRIYYRTAYDTTNRICGYVIPFTETENYYLITRSQYNRALKNRTIGGDAGIIFESDKRVMIDDIDF